MIEIIPAIDLIDGCAVRLTKGDYGQKKVYDSDPAVLAMKFADSGVRRIHVVDLDGAKVSRPVNLNVLEKISSEVSIEIEWGGGIASGEHLRDIFSAGATQAIVGSLAVKNPELFSQWLSDYRSQDKIILGADTKKGKIAIKGWLEDTDVTVDDLIRKYAPMGLKSVICTDISRDGMLEGPSFDLYRRLVEEYPDIVFTASGGISCMDDIRKLDSDKVQKVIVGKAIYENRITLNEISKWSQNV